MAMASVCTIKSPERRRRGISDFTRFSIKVGSADDLEWGGADLDSGVTDAESGGADIAEIGVLEENNIPSNGTGTKRVSPRNISELPEIPLVCDRLVVGPSPSANANTRRANVLLINWVRLAVELGEDSMDYSELDRAHTNLCRSLPDHLDAACRRLSNLKGVLQLFDKDELVGSKEYKLALEGIMKFRQSWHLFQEGLDKLFPSIYEEQKLMSDQLEAKIFKLEKKLRLIKFWGKVASVLTLAVVVLVATLTIMESRIAFPLAVTIIIAIFSVLVAGGLGKGVNSLFSNYEEKLTKKLDIIDSVKSKNTSMLKIIQDIHALVDDLLSEMEPLYSTDVFVRDGEALVLAMDKMKKALTKSTQKIENLSRHANEFRGGAQRSENMILQDIGATSST